MRYRLTLEFEGTLYSGWQKQNDFPTIQEELEKAFEGVFQEVISVTASGRTDAGVHAHAQIAHCDINDNKNMSALEVSRAVNAHLLTKDIVITACEETLDDFHARFNAKRKLYRYRILNRTMQPTMTKNFVWHVKQPLDEKIMDISAKDVIGRHDFTSFRDTACQAKTPVRSLDELNVHRVGDEVIIEALGQSFLHHQVRNLVGSLVLIGKGRETTDFMKRALDARDRRAAGPTAPPQGLALVSVEYPS